MHSKGFVLQNVNWWPLLSLMPVVFRGHADRNFYFLRVVRGHFLVLHKKIEDSCKQPDGLSGRKKLLSPA